MKKIYFIFPPKHIFIIYLLLHVVVVAVFAGRDTTGLYMAIWHHRVR
jgi:hypothetical protein